MKRVPLLLLTFTAAAAPPATAQQLVRAPVSLRLDSLLHQALRADPRRRQLALQSAAAAIGQQNISAELLPSLAIDGTAQYQSDVAKLPVPITLPGGATIPAPSHETYDAHLNATEPLWDPSRGARRAAGDARLATEQAQTRSTLYTLRQEVVSTFFAAAQASAERRALAQTIADLDARRREAVDRLNHGAALPSDTAMLAATILQREQDDTALAAAFHAAIDRLGLLVGETFPDSVELGIPDLGDAVRLAREQVDSLRSRPEYAQFAATDTLLSRTARVLDSRQWPKLMAFGRAGYGRPGLNPLNTGFEGYFVGGLEVQWTPWTWGVTRRQRDSLAVERNIVATNEAAFTASLARQAASDVASIDQLSAALALDNRIIVLRSQVEQETQTQLNAGVVTTASYVDRASDVLQARLAAIAHQIARAQAQVHLLTTLGVEVP
jgi:outer membrane protein TolC